jgi:hypothetical protein
MDADPKQQWHWGEGTKYALECMRSLLLLNGGAPIALLTFLGGSNRIKLNAAGVSAIDHSLIGFGIGVLSSVLLFSMAYFTQLFYGNGSDRVAARYHYAVYACVVLSLAGFGFGTWFAKNAVIAALSLP